MAAVKAIKGNEKDAEGAKQADKEVTDTWLKVFTEMIKKSGEVSETPEEAAKKPTRRLPEPITRDEKEEPAKETTEAVIDLSQKVTDKTGETKPIKKPKETQKIIESRLDFLTKMFTSNKGSKEEDEESKEEEDSEEDNKEKES